jgi:oxalate decarboxylase/phosphoglucose isomerase-like protein (cupin superfamily)
VARSKSNRTYVKECNVEAQVFDWGRLWWLSEPRVTAAERFSAGIVQLEPGKGHTRHNHPGCEEILFVLTGSGRQVVEVAGESREQVIGPGVLVHIPPDAYHSTVNLGTEPMRILAIYAPPGPEAELRRMKGVKIEPPVEP